MDGEPSELGRRTTLEPSRNSADLRPLPCSVIDCPFVKAWKSRFAVHGMRVGIRDLGARNRPAQSGGTTHERNCSSYTNRISASRGRSPAAEVEPGDALAHDVTLTCPTLPARRTHQSTNAQAAPISRLLHSWARAGALAHPALGEETIVASLVSLEEAERCRAMFGGVALWRAFRRRDR
jgi:hypothetical protein